MSDLSPLEIELHMLIKDIYSTHDPLLHITTVADRSKLVQALIAAGYRKPRIITTAEELDAMLEDSVIRTAGHEEFAPRVAVKSLRFDSGVSYWHVADADDFESTSDELDDLPATVLYEPEQP